MQRDWPGFLKFARARRDHPAFHHQCMLQEHETAMAALRGYPFSWLDMQRLLILTGEIPRDDRQRTSYWG